LLEILPESNQDKASTLEALVKLKPLARFIYGNIPGAAAARFVLKDWSASWFVKQEFYGVRRFSMDGGTIIDVGANRGQSIAAFRKLSPKSTIVAFEPEPISVRRLSAKYSRHANVIVYSCALGENREEKAIFVPTYGWWTCDGMAATTFEEATTWLNDSERMLFFNRKKLSVEEFYVEFKPLDAFSLSPAILKIHAQGAELNILKGATKTLMLHQPAIMCAFPRSDVNDYLSNFGYAPFTYAARQFSPGVASSHVTFTWYLTKRLLNLLDISAKS
jgi:FkbM family methyltransferase